MASLTQIRDTLALSGIMDARQLSRLLTTPLPLVQAMLDRLVAMGKIEAITAEDNHCLSGSCQGCPEGQQCTDTIYYRPCQ
jgi:ferrous iron transport protein C